MSALARWRRIEGTPAISSFLTLYDVAGAAVFISILAVAAVPRFDADFWWHLYTGMHILSSGVPSNDFLSFTAKGHAWIDHEWLSEAIIWMLAKLGGFSLVLGFFALVTAGAFLTTFSLMKTRGVQPMFALLLVLIGATATLGTWGPRIQMLSLLFAGLFCIILERYRATADIRWLGLMAAGMLVWSNLHGGFAVGLILIGAYLIGGTLDRMHEGMSRGQAVRRQRPLALALVACFAVTFLNPNTYHTALYPLRFVTPNLFTNTIQESLSPNFHLFQLLPFELLLVGLVVCALLTRRRVSWIDILLCVSFTHLALQESRNIDLWCIVVLPIVGYYLQDAATPISKKLGQMNRPVKAARLPVLNWLVLVGMVVAGISFVLRADSASNVLAAARATDPTAAVKYIKQHDLTGHVFNSYAYGGYLIWSSQGSIPVFIDSRADTVYSDNLLRDYLAIYNAKPAWQQLLKRYSIQWVFVEKSAPIATVLSQAGDWKSVFEGQEAAIYEQR